MTNYPFYDAAGIGRFADENEVLRKLKAGEKLSDEEVSFVRSARFYWHTPVQDEVRKLGAALGIGKPLFYFAIEPKPGRGDDCA